MRTGAQINFKLHIFFVYGYRKNFKSIYKEYKHRIPDPQHPLVRKFCYLFVDLNGLGASQPLDVKVAEDHGRQKAAFYAGYPVGPQEGATHTFLLESIECINRGPGFLAALWPPLPPLPSASFLSFIDLVKLTEGRSGGRGVGVEPNHTSARSL
jgi:hypothetical protein